MEDKKPELNDDLKNEIKETVAKEIAEDDSFYMKALKELRQRNDMKFEDSELEKSYESLMSRYESQ